MELVGIEGVLKFELIVIKLVIDVFEFMVSVKVVEKVVSVVK